MTFTISRNKNIINFLAEDKEQPYAFDINTGILYSLKSKPLKNFPNGLKSCIDSNKTFDFVLFIMGMMLDRCYSFHDSWSWKLADFQECANLLMVADKINSLGYTPKHNDDWRIDRKSLNLIDENFKDFARYCEEEEEPTIYGFFNTYYPVIWAEKHGIEVNEIITADVCRYIMSADFSDEQLEYLIKCFRRGVLYFYMSDYDGHIYVSEFLNTLRTYFEHCEELNLKYDKDFFRGVALANRMYQTHKQEIDNRNIANQMNKHNYDFEDDNFTIVVPQTTKDFLDEATHQNNCVYNLYMGKVARGDTNVVFIRKKSNPSKSYITCEITNKGHIQQYLLANNNRVGKDTAEYDFKVALQKWLDENWA